MTRASYTAQFIYKEKVGVSKEEKKDIEKKIRAVILSTPKGETPVFPDEVLAFFTPLIKTIIKKKMDRDSRRGMKTKDDFNDLVQEAMIGLLHGLSKFDPTKANSPTTYVHYWINNHIQKFRKKMNSIVKSDSVYHSLFTFIREKIDDNLNIDEIMEFFEKADKKNGDWVYPPKEVKINHNSIKKITVLKHINAVIHNNRAIAINQTSENENFIDYESYEMNLDKGKLEINSSYIQNDFSFSEFKDEIIEILKNINKFSSEEKNLFIEYFNLGKPQFLVTPNIFSNSFVDYSYYSSKRKKISRSIYFAEKYGLSRNKVKKTVMAIIETIKPIIIMQIDV